MESKQVTVEFAEKCGRNPSLRELFILDGQLYVFRGGPTQWEHLAPVEDPHATVEVGCLEFELQPGIVVRGTPGFIISLALRAFYGIKASDAGEFASLVPNIFKECGWRGPVESEFVPIPGTVSVQFRDRTIENRTADIRPVHVSLQDPDFSGWLALEDGENVRFINVSQAEAIDVSRDPEGDKA